MRWYSADELLDKMLLNEPLVRSAQAPLRDLYECSEHVYTEWCKAHLGTALDQNFDLLARRADAIEISRSTLRGYVLVSAVATTLK